MSEAIDRLKRRLRWWHAKRFGEKPTCENDGCDSDAYWYLGSDGYRCGMCYIKGQPWHSPGFMRELHTRADYDE